MVLNVLEEIFPLLDQKALGMRGPQCFQNTPCQDIAILDDGTLRAQPLRNFKGVLVTSARHGQVYL